MAFTYLPGSHSIAFSGRGYHHSSKASGGEDLQIEEPVALVQLNGDIFLFYNKSLGDLNVEKFTHQHPRRVDGVDDVWHAYPHSSRHLYDVGIARKLDWRLYKQLF